MPESQDDDDSGHFQLVMTRRSKARKLASVIVPLPQNETVTNNGVNGS